MGSATCPPDNDLVFVNKDVFRREMYIWKDCTQRRNRCSRTVGTTHITPRFTEVASMSDVIGRDKLLDSIEIALVPYLFDKILDHGL